MEDWKEGRVEDWKGEDWKEGRLEGGKGKVILPFSFLVLNFFVR